MKNKALIFGLVGAISIGAFSGCNDNKKQESQDKIQLQVFIAASLKNAMEEIEKKYESEHQTIDIVFNPNSTGILQKQVEEGANCDLFFSAASKQLEALDKEGFVIEGSLTDVLKNQVVLIKPKDKETKVTSFEDITKAGNIALAGEDVPVGAYAREIFTYLGVLEDVMSMEINEGTNVTAVLAAVSEGSNEVGVVYATDAMSAKDKVEVICKAPEEALKKPVIYPLGLIKNKEADEKTVEEAKSFYEYLKGEEAFKVFESYGFSK